MASLFLSYDRRDRAAVEALSQRLKAWGYASVFLDVDPDLGIEVGADWEAALYRNLRVCDAVLFVGTKHSASSRWCFAELALARSAGKPVLPLAFEDGIDVGLLLGEQWLRIDGDRRAFDHLERVLNRRFPPGDAFAWDARRAPYPGLASFQLEDAAMFFGRDLEVENLIARLDATLGQGRCVAVIGPSGSGKSSLVRAGVLPRIARLAERWLVLEPMTPGSRPVAALARSLGDRVAYQQRLERDPTELAELIRDQADGRSVLLVVDQAEELAIQAAGGERERFLAALDAALRANVRLWVLATLRSEFLTASLDGSGLGRLIDETVLVEPLDRSRLPEVIAGPARRAGLELEATLTERMAADTPRGDALPLLAYTLRELYDRDALTLAGYEALGGVAGALALRADRVLDRLSRDGHGAAVMPALLRLASVDPQDQPVRRPVARDHVPLEEQPVLDAFAEARLLTTRRPKDGETTIEVAHEALLRAWPPLRAAIAASSERLRVEAELERDAEEWRQARDESYLLHGERLARARLLVNSPGSGGVETLGTGAREFYLTSEALERRQRRGRRIRWSSAGAAVLAAVALLAFVTQRSVRDSRRAADERDTAQSLLIATNGAEDLLSRPDRALAVALRAYNLKSTPLAEGLLRDAVQASVPQVILHAGAAVSTIGVAPDGRHVAIDERVFDLQHPTARPIRMAQEAAINAFSPDGVHMAGGTLNTPIRVWEWRKPASIVATLPDSRRATTVVFTPNGRDAAVVEDTSIRLWNWRSGRTVVLARYHPPATDKSDFSERGFADAAFSPDGRRLAAIGPRKILVWDLNRKRSPLRINAPKARTLVFAPDGRHLFLASTEATTQIADLRHPGTTVELPGSRGCGKIVFAPDGRHLFCPADNEVEIWRWPSPDQPSVVLRGHTRRVTDIAVTPDGRRVLSSSEDGTVRIWNWQDAAEPSPPIGRQSAALRLAVSRDGARIAIIYKDGHVAVYDTRHPSRPPAMLAAKGSPPSIAFPPHPGNGERSLGHSRRVIDSAGLRALYGNGALSADGSLVTYPGSGGTWVQPIRPGSRAVLVPQAAGGKSAAGPGALATADLFSGTVRVWDWRHPKQRPAVLRRPTEAENLYGGEVYSLAVSPGGSVVSVGSEADPTVTVWEWRKGKATTTFTLAAMAQSIALSPDGRHVATADFAGNVDIWDRKAPALPPIIVPSLGADVAFAADGRHLAFFVTSRAAVWRCDACGPIDTVRALARARLPREIHLR